MLNHSEAWSCQLKTRSLWATGERAEFDVPAETVLVESELCVFAIHLLHAKSWQVGFILAALLLPEKAATSVVRLASLREDYLNQVQRDFLSQPAVRSACQHP
jgi:hypothetical protein